MRVFVIGFMGSGKSTLGKPIARALGCDFVDLDHYIEKSEGMTISEIFAQKGEAAFRALENHYLCQLSELDNVVVSTGGGTPCFNSNMELMNRMGQTVYLKQEPKTLANRLIYSKNKRPLIEGKTPEQLLEYIRTTLAVREQFYNQASVVVDNPDRDAKRIIDILTLNR